jgi:hypothetical protein
MRPLIDGDNPLLIESETQLPWPQRLLALTALGRQVLNGKAYWPDHATAERWVGGVCLRPRHSHWTIEEHGVPVWRD